MKTRRRWRWIAGVTLLAAALALQARTVEAEKRIQVWVTNTNLNQCERDEQGNRYVGEAQGRAQIGGAMLCEAFTTGGTAMATCPLPLAGDLQHQVRIIRRGPPNYGVVGSEFVSSGGGGASWTPWNSLSPAVEHTLTAGACSGTTIRAVSFARDVSP